MTSRRPPRIFLTGFSGSGRSQVALLVVLPLVAATCGGGEPAREVRADDLPGLLLTQEELGDKFAGLEPFVEESGTISNEEAVEQAQDADAARAHIEKFGRMSGYQSAFQGAALVVMQVTLYENADGASGALADMLEEMDRKPGPSAQIETEQFDAGAIGEEARGVVGRQPEGPNFALVAVRVDGVVALVEEVVSPMSPLADEKEMQDDVRGMARKVAGKIDAALGR